MVVFSTKKICRLKSSKNLFRLVPIIFVNLAYYSNLIRLFVKNCDFNEPHDNNFLLEMFKSSHSDTTKKNALKALKATVRNSPIHSNGLAKPRTACDFIQPLSIRRALRKSLQFHADRFT